MLFTSNTDSSYWKAQHVLATREIRLRTTCYIIAPYFINKREKLEKDKLKHGIWPISKHDLITKHLKSFMKFTNSIDFDKL